MSIKGYPTQKKLLNKLSPYTDKQSQSTSEYVTVQPSSSDKELLNTANMGLYRLHGTVKTVTSVDAVWPKRSFVATAHGALVGDVIRFDLASENPGFEATVLSTPDADTIILGAELLADIQSGDEFFILRYVSPRYDDSGALSTSAGPIQFVLDAVNTEVLEDTGTPANNIPLPVKMLTADGDIGHVVKGTDIAQKVTGIGNDVVDTLYHDYSGAAVSNAAWTQVSASIADDCVGLTCFDSGGYSMEIAVGAAASEVRLFLLPPGGFNGVIPIRIASGARVSVRAIGAASVAVGELIINLLK